MKHSPRSLLKANKRALKSADPRSRDRLRHRVKVLEIVIALRKRGRAA
jgi:hypothetical protein